MIEIKPVKAGSQEEKDFLSLPSLIYSKSEIMQNLEEEQQQIAGCHVLSHYYQLQAYVAYQDKKIQARCALIYYPHITEAYLGYFEAFDNQAVISELFAKMKQEARSRSKSALIGPVNASFWLGYRMKTSDFHDTIFSGEPHNPSYYPNLWQEAGFVETDCYLSNFYGQVELGQQQKKMENRYREFAKKGYHIFSPKRSDWENYAPQVFRLLSQLYQDFPTYQSIKSSEFSQVFSSLKFALDFSMVKLAYYQDELVGFLISMPDYGNLIHKKMSWLDILTFFKVRHRAKRYILLYLGVKPGHLGLGSALSFPVYQSVQKRKALTIGALIHQGKVTQNYAPELQEKRRSYALYRLDL
ncbi:hypothetical protein ACTGZQ_06385 [Streptococcus suis]